MTATTIRPGRSLLLAAGGDTVDGRTIFGKAATPRQKDLATKAPMPAKDAARQAAELPFGVAEDPPGARGVKLAKAAADGKRHGPGQGQGQGQGQDQDRDNGNGNGNGNGKNEVQNKKSNKATSKDRHADRDRADERGDGRDGNRFQPGDQGRAAGGRHRDGNQGRRWAAMPPWRPRSAVPRRPDPRPTTTTRRARSEQETP